MRPEVELFLYDVLRAAEKVARFIHGKSLVSYLADDLLQSAVERQLYVVGEALVQAVKLDPLLETQLSDVPHIKRFRNLLAHAYFKVRNEIVWEIASRELPVLNSEIQALVGPPSDP